VAQFTAYRNLDPASRARVPFLLDVQAELLADLATRVVVPLYSAASLKGKLLKTLTPEFRVGGRSCVMATPELAGVPRKVLGAPVADLSAKRTEIIAALDLLLTGI
jgi:toxin CcdB